jgi:HD-GYP domain-containing protein (c-di-GMP phosphodiesterase class II)
LDLINTISEVARVPLLLVDADANPVFRSSYYFSFDLESQLSTCLKKTLSCVNSDEGKLYSIAPGLEAVISPATVFNQPMYLVAGYFTDTANQQLHRMFPEQVMSELITKNLTGEWNDKRNLLLSMNNNLAHFLRKLHKSNDEIQKIYEFIRLIYANQGIQGETFWEEALKKICSIFPSYWGGVVLFPAMKNSYAFICSEKNRIRRLEAFNCMLSQWIKETGEAVYLPDAAKDLRTEEFLLLEPELERLLSLPLKSDNGVWGVLHFALKADICPRDLELLQGFGQYLGNLEDYDSTKHTKRKESLLDCSLGLIIGLLGQERDENVFHLVAEALFKGLKCHSLGIYLQGDEGQFYTTAACSLSKAQVKQDCILLEQLYGGKVYIQHPLRMNRPQGSGYWEVPIGGASERYDGFLIIRKNAEFNDEEQECILRVAKICEVFLSRQRHKKQENQRIYELMDGMIAMLEGHLPWLKEHAEKTALYATTLGRAAGLPEREVSDLTIAARLHDIGKIKISPALFSKSGKLTLAEKRRLERFGMFGAEILSSIPTLACYAPVLAQLEENVDGSGYPRGLKEEEIHPHSLIIRIASTYSALTATRAYRDTLQEALALDSMAKEVEKKLSMFYYSIFKKVVSTNARINASAGVDNSEVYQKLTPREREVLEMIASGKNNNEIAAELYISEKTVKIHVSNLLQKLALKDRTQAAIFFLTNK